MPQLEGIRGFTVGRGGGPSLGIQEQVLFAYNLHVQPDKCVWEEGEGLSGHIRPCPSFPNHMWRFRIKFIKIH